MARFPAEVAQVRALFGEYLNSLAIDLSFQQADAELADLPGKYAQPRGGILIARDAAHQPLGCVALRPHGPALDCEMKRLYVRPGARGLDLGRQLVLRLLEHAVRLGYARMLLDTLATMHAVQRLYVALGFTQVAAYYVNPVPGTVYMALDLTRLSVR